MMCTVKDFRTAQNPVLQTFLNLIFVQLGEKMAKKATTHTRAKKKKNTSHEKQNKKK